MSGALTTHVLVMSVEHGSSPGGNRVQATVEVLEPALLLPTTVSADEAGPRSRANKFRSCHYVAGAYSVVDVTESVVIGQFCEASIHLPNHTSATDASLNRWGVPTHLPSVSVPRTDVKKLNSSKTAVYLGLLPNLYGHFLVEGLARLWWAAPGALPATMHPRPSVAFYVKAPSQSPPHFNSCTVQKTSPLWRYPWITRLNLSRVFDLDIRVLTSPTLVRKLYVPAQLTRMYSKMPKRMAGVYRHLAAWHARAALPRGTSDPHVARCIYVSRSAGNTTGEKHMSGSGADGDGARGSLTRGSTGTHTLHARRRSKEKLRLENEAEVEGAFARRGFTIVRPGATHIGSEMRMLRGAAVMAGFQVRVAPEMMRVCHPVTLTLALTLTLQHTV
jgi:hypothetical protein